jgi:phage tail tape-measure protein
MATLGEFRVGIDFNPGKNPTVDTLKKMMAGFIDMVSEMETTGDINEVNRLKALAMTHAEDAAMWAVKAATKPER